MKNLGTAIILLIFIA